MNKPIANRFAAFLRSNNINPERLSAKQLFDIKNAYYSGVGDAAIYIASNWSGEINDTKRLVINIGRECADHFADTYLNHAFGVILS